MYLPLSPTMREGVTATPLFYGAVSVYLEEKIPLLGGARRRAGNILDSPFLLHLAAKFAGSTRPTGLEDMTVSVL